MTGSAPFRRQRLRVLGATGSVGAQTLDVVERHPEQLPRVRPEGAVAPRLARRTAADEEAVAAFLAGAFRFDQIHTVIAGTFEAYLPGPSAGRIAQGLCWIPI